MAKFDSSDFEQSITDRIDFSTVMIKPGDTGDMEQSITDRIDFSTFSEVAVAPPAAAIMPQMQTKNLGADLFDGALLIG